MVYPKGLMILVLALLFGLLPGPSQAAEPVSPWPEQRHYRADETPPGLTRADWQQIVDHLQRPGLPGEGGSLQHLPGHKPGPGLAVGVWPGGCDRAVQGWRLAVGLACAAGWSGRGVVAAGPARP